MVLLKGLISDDDAVRVETESLLADKFVILSSAFMGAPLLRGLVLAKARLVLSDLSVVGDGERLDFMFNFFRGLSAKAQVEIIYSSVHPLN